MSPGHRAASAPESRNRPTVGEPAHRATERDRAERLQGAISSVLRYGVLASLAVIVAGVVLTFTGHTSYVTSSASVHQLTRTRDFYFPNSASDFFEALSHAYGPAVTTLGLGLLLLTPIARVAVSIALFAAEHDTQFVIVSTMVLVIVLAASAVGVAI